MRRVYVRVGVRGGGGGGGGGARRVAVPALASD